MRINSLFLTRHNRPYAQTDPYQFLPIDSPVSFSVKRHVRVNTVTSPHWHNFIQLWYAPKGKHIHGFLNKSFIISPGEFLIVPPYFSHDLFPLSDEPFIVHFYSFTEGFLKSIMDNPDDCKLFLFPRISTASGTPGFRLTEEDKYTVEAMFDDIYTAYKKDPKNCEVLYRGKIVQLFRLFIRYLRDSGKPTAIEQISFMQKYLDPLTRAITFINSNFQKNISIEDICKQACMSKTLLCCAFKQLTGNTVVEYISMIRLSHVRNALILTNDPVLEIAEKNGFYSKSHFYNHFKYFEGYTPDQFRHEQREIEKHQAKLDSIL